MDWEKVAKKLKKPLDESHIQRRQAKFGTVEYLPSWLVIKQANEIFGYGNWQREIKRLEKVYEDAHNGTYTVAYLCEARTIVGEAVHEDVGFGVAANFSDPTAAHEKAVKQAVSDSLKRCLRAFGAQFGLSLYEHTQQDESPTPSPAPGAGQDPDEPHEAEGRITQLRASAWGEGEDAIPVTYITLDDDTPYVWIERTRNGDDRPLPDGVAEGERVAFVWHWSKSGKNRLIYEFKPLPDPIEKVKQEGEEVPF
jgi:DNA recombination protein Rad52